MHIKRSVLQAYIWLNADQDNPSKDLDPVEYGWKISDETSDYEPIWFEGEVAPSNVLKVLDDDESSPGNINSTGVGI